ncbi:cation transporting ATPase C-terminal domain-containing protein [Actinoplanes sp. NPDC049265]|uniref:cation transporting ATPase C-terminal domain-containing protein n=1 Tax=Actinoplanes sp. NPDC049265 TaxID=3363902 RepID=UPI00371668CE
MPNRLPVSMSLPPRKLRVRTRPVGPEGPSTSPGGPSALLRVHHGGRRWSHDRDDRRRRRGRRTHAYQQATTMTFAGIVACQIGTAFAARTDRAALRSIGLFSNRPLLAGIAFELVFAAALIYLPPLRAVFGTAALHPAQLAVLLPFPLLVWGADEWYRAHGRRVTARSR